jgi:tRNA(Arg) A34 adenosine deaminase TadA
MEYNKRYRHFTPGPSRHTLHAELAALLTVPTAMLDRINWKDVSVYVYRICPGHKSGMGLARPCPSCMHQIKELGIHHIYYTTDDGYAYERLDY